MAATPPRTHKAPWYLRLLGLSDQVAHAQSQEAQYRPGPGAGAGYWEWIRTNMQMNQDRKSRYQVYDQMDGHDLVRAALDIHAEETTQTDYDKQRVVWCESDNSEIVKLVDQALANTKAEEYAPVLVRSFCKYGDRFQRLFYEAGVGVLGWTTFAPGLVDRLDDIFGRLVGFRAANIKFRGALDCEVSWPWDLVHFRLFGRDDVLDSIRVADNYGQSLLDTVFRSWRQLALSEDAMLMARLKRAGDHAYIFLPVGDMDETEAESEAAAYAARLNRNEFMDPASPNYRHAYNPLTMTEDVVIPIRGDGDQVRFETVPGSNMGELYDLEHYRQKFFGGMRIPPSYLGFEGELNAKATLAQQDIRFARTGKRIQRAELMGLRTMTEIHLKLVMGENYTPDDRKYRYLLKGTPISYLDEYERLDLFRLRNDIATSAAGLGQTLQVDTRTWATYILSTYARLPPDLVVRLVARSDGAEGEEAAAVESEVSAGFTELSKAEKDAIGKMMVSNPSVQRVVQLLSELHKDDPPSDLDAAIHYQRDPSMSAVIGAKWENGQPVFTDQSAHPLAGGHRQQLQEHLQKVRDVGEGTQKDAVKAQVDQADVVRRSAAQRLEEDEAARRAEAEEDVLARRQTVAEWRRKRRERGRKVTEDEGGV